MTFGQASHSSVRRIGPSSSAFFTGGGGGGSGRSSSSTGISATPISDISAPARDGKFRRAPFNILGADPAAHARFLARQGPIPRARSAMGACAIAGERGCFSPTDQTNGGLPPAVGFKCTGIWRPQPAARPSNRPCSTLVQAGMIIADIGHQLPALLPDFERAAGLADLGDIVLRLEQHAQERRKILGAAAARPGTRARSRRNTACRSACR